MTASSYTAALLESADLCDEMGAPEIAARLRAKAGCAPSPQPARVVCAACNGLRVYGPEACGNCGGVGEVPSPQPATATVNDARAAICAARDREAAIYREEDIEGRRDSHQRIVGMTAALNAVIALDSQPATAGDVERLARCVHNRAPDEPCSLCRARGLVADDEIVMLREDVIALRASTGGGNNG